MLGDNMGDNQEASDNICIDCGQYGMAIAGGQNNRLLRNIIMGRRHDWSNVGLYVWGIPQRNSRVSNAIVRENTISWVNRFNKRNPIWISSQNVFGVVNELNRIEVQYYVPPCPATVGAASK